MKKITCLIDNLGSGGAQRQLVNLAILLKEKCYDIQFITYQRNDFYKHILEDARISVECIETSRPLVRIWKVCNALRYSQADTVITFLETPGFLACVAKMCGAKWKLLTSELSAQESTFHGIKQKIYNWFERYSDIKVCNSHNAAQMWAVHYPKYTDKLRVIYNPVLIPQMDVFSNEEEVCHMVVAASYQKLKNPLGVIEALQLLDDDERCRIRVDWYGKAEVTTGDTTIYDESLRRINENGLHEVIRLNSETKQIYQIMSQADVVGLFSTVEGLPNAICEAMALKKPIIMTRVSDYEVLAEGNGILCNSDSESIAQALRHLLSLTKEELADMGQKSFEKAEKLFKCEAITRQWIELIED